MDGRGPGDVLDVVAGQRVPVRVRSEGLGVESVELVGPDGFLARAADGDGIDATMTVEGSSWLCAVVRGPAHPSVPGPVVFAHTSPVHLEVGGRRVRRAASARWLLDWLDRCEHLVREHATFADDAQRADVVEVLERARRHYRALAG